MEAKKRKLSLVERINHFKTYNRVDWKTEVAKVEVEGFTHDEAVLETLNRFSVPLHGRTIVKGTVVTKVY